MGMLYMGDAEVSNLKYVLVQEADLRLYSWFLPFLSPRSKVTADGRSRYIAIEVAQLKTAVSGLYRWFSY